MSYCNLDILLVFCFENYEGKISILNNGITTFEFDTELKIFWEREKSLILNIIYHQKQCWNIVQKGEMSVYYFSVTHYGNYKWGPWQKPKYSNPN